MNTPTRQRIWQMKMQAQGRCITCGEPRVTKNHCEKHADYQAAYLRKKNGHQPWRPGSRGCAPINREQKGKK